MGYLFICESVYREKMIGEKRKVRMDNSINCVNVRDSLSCFYALV